MHITDTLAIALFDNDIQPVQLIHIYHQATTPAQHVQLTVSVKKKDWLSVHVLRDTTELHKERRIYLVNVSYKASALGSRP